MRVPDNSLRSVGFVSEVINTGTETEELDHFATGFFVSVPSSTVPGMMFMYFVTARHVVRHLNGKDVRLTVNKRGGGIKHVEGMGNIFWSHPSDDAADVAVLPIFGDKEMDIVHVSTSQFITPEIMVRQKKSWVESGSGSLPSE